MIRVIALAMLAWALWQTGSVVRAGFEGSLPQLEEGMRSASFGLWSVVSCFMLLLALFGGVQLFRLRLSGWIASLTFLAIGTGWLAYVNTFDWQWLNAHPAMPRLDFTNALDSLSLLWAESHFENSERFGRFVLACYFVALLCVALEWRRFLFPFDFKPSWRFSLVKAGSIGLFFLAAAGWNLWGAEYVQYLAVAKRINANPPKADSNELRALSRRRKSQAYALLIRRLERERTKAVAQCLIEFTGRFDPLDVQPSVDLKALTPADTAALIAASHSEDVLVQMTCFSLLGQMATREAKQCLRGRLDGPVDTAWSVALYALARAGADAAPDKAFNVAASPGPERARTLKCIPLFHDPRVGELLISLAADPDPETRQCVLESLRFCPGEKAERTLLEALKSPDKWCWRAAVLSLARVGTQASIPALIECLGQPDVTLPTPGLWSRFEMPRRGFDLYAMWPEFSSINRARYSSADGCAAVALRVITLEDFGEDAILWRRWWQENEKTFDMKKRLAAILAESLPEPAAADERFASGPNKSVIDRQFLAVSQIRSHDFRDMAPDLARYLARAGSGVGVKRSIAYDLTSWGFREGIDWLIEDRDSWTPESRWTTLASVTGVNFFGDIRRWREWWKANREKFPSALEERQRDGFHRKDAEHAKNGNTG